MRNLNIHALYRSVNNLCEFLDTEYNINNGGCCFIAALLAKHLDHLKIPYNLVVYDDFGRDIESIQYEVFVKVKNSSYRNSVTGKSTCSHYCLYIIGAGEVNSGNFSGYKYTIKDVCSSNIRWIYRCGKWNPCYDTANNNTIKSIVKSFFKRYEMFSFR